jgi:ribulose-5-phosphate 4-epimerase/fuculose-1-phosphate aldolase
MDAKTEPADSVFNMGAPPPQLANGFPPRQPTLELERLHRKQKLAAAYRLFAHFKFDMGGAGHITARDPEHEDCFWVNPALLHFSEIKVSELMLVSHNGEILQPPATKPPILNAAAFAIHSRLHLARPDVIAAAHSHSLYGKAFSTLGRLVDPLTQDAAAFYGDQALFTPYTGSVVDLEEADRLAQTLGSRNALILQNHGLLTVGGSVDAAVWRYLAYENACQTQLLAMSAGTPEPMSEDVARHTFTQTGTEQIFWIGFQPYWQWITAKEPDLLD